MDVRLLGPFEVVDEGRTLTLGGRRQRAVLALLAMHVGEVVSIDQIVEDVWAGSPPPSAVRTVHAYISRLRSTLHHPSSAGGTLDVLVSQEPGYRLAVDKSEVDAVRFERMMVSGSASLAARRPEEAADTLTEALALWRGTALADFAYEPFAAQESQRLMGRRIDTVEVRIDAELALARHGSAVTELEGLVVEHPLRERFWAQLMIALYRCGRQADALAAYGTVRRNLVEELGIEPGPELRRLEGLVLEQSDELAWRPIGREAIDVSRPATEPEGHRGARPGDGAEAGHHSLVKTSRSATHDRPTAMPLVGRDLHLERLTAYVRQAKPNERPLLVILTGEAGCGKTRLLAEFGRVASADGVLVTAGSAEHETSLPYGPFAEIVRSILDQTGPSTLERVGHLHSDLAWLVPELGPVPSGPSGDLSLARSRLFEAVVQLLSTAGHGEPLLVLVDDAQRLESTSLIQAMLDRVSSRPMVVVMAYRTDPTDRRTRPDDKLVGLLRREGAVSLEVGRLSRDDLTTLVTRVHGHEEDPETRELVARLSEQTGGIPLLVREILPAAINVDGPGPAVDTTRATVSPLIEAVIDQKLRPILDDTRRLLEVAAIAGMHFDIDVVATVANTETGRVDDLLEEAFRAGVIVEAGTVDRYAFDHGLIREAIVSSLSTRRQLRLHGQIAEALAERGSAVDAARHGLAGYVASISAETVVALVLRGADAALASLDFEVARALCADALSGPAEALDPEAQAELLVRLGRAQSLSGHFEEAEQAWRSAADLVRSTGDTERLAEIALGTEPHARIFTSASDLRWALLTEAMDALGPGWSRLRLLVATQWILEAALPTRRAVTLELANEIVEAARALDDPEALVAALQTRCFLARTRHLPERQQWSRDLRHVAEQLGSDEWLFHAYLEYLVDSVADGDGEGMEEGLDLLRQTCARYGAPRALWVFKLVAANHARLLGEFEIAEEHANEAATVGERYGIGDTLAAIGAAGFVNAYHRGGLETLRTVLEKFAEATPDIPAWTFGAGIAAAADHDIDGARAALDRGVEALTDAPEQLWLPALCLAAELVGWTGTSGTVVERLTRLLSPHAGQFAIVGTFTSDFGPTDRCLGLLSAATGDIEEAGNYFAAGVDISRRLRARPWELRTQADWLVTERTVGLPARSWWADLESELTEAGLNGAIARLHAD